MEQSRIKQLFDKLEEDQNYTVWKFGEMGFPQCFNITLISKQLTSYAQYDEALLIKFKIKGKRKLSGFYIYGTSSPFIFWEGWYNTAQASNWWESQEYHEETKRSVRTGYTCFSDEYIKQALKSITAEPVALFNVNLEEVINNE